VARRAWSLAFLVAALGGADAASGQVSRACSPVLVGSGAAGQGLMVRIAPGVFHQFISGRGERVRIRCEGQSTTVEADSLAWYQDLNRLDFEGRVEFRDTSALLESNSARYFPLAERLEAYGDVRLEDESTRSVLTGPNLTYYRAVPGLRDVTELFATQRPTVEYRPVGAAVDDPYLIRGERVRLKGGALAWAGGGVTIDRENFAAKSDSAELDFEQGHGLLIRRAEAIGTEAPRYEIRGDRLAFRIEEGELNWVQAQQAAQALSTEWVALGDTIEFAIARNRIQAGLVWGDSTRATARSARQVVVADSLAIDTPEQVLTEIRGFGTSRATTRQEGRPDDAADWIEGDTLVAQFGDVGDGRRGLVMVRATWVAKALYHIYADVMGDQPAINYSRGRRITAYFKGDVLDRVDIVEIADGVYLEPVAKRPP
jgi:hypothetical protein